MLKEYLVFDIETAPIEWDTLAESQQEYLLRNAQTEEEIEKRKFEMALTPMTAHVVCIGLQMMKQQEDGTYEMTSRAAFSSVPDSVYEENKDIELSTGAHCYIRREEKVLTDFWAILTKYPRACLISFNGRNFDAPFLMLRSALLGIKPSRNLMAGTKFNYQGHIDLIDELTFYAGSQYGATRRYNFDFYTRAFGLVSPKAEGVDGSMVGELYREGKVDVIAEYCLRDVNATWELFKIWDERLNFSR